MPLSVAERKGNKMIKKLTDREKRNFRPLIAAHRGTYSGNFIQNTLPAFKNSLIHNDDIVEMDVELSADGILYLMHSNMEKLLLNCDKSIREMNSSEIDQLKYVNVVRLVTEQKVGRLDEALEALKGKCLINIDRAWDFFPQVFKVVNEKDMFSQIIFKSGLKDGIFEIIKDSGFEINFMPIVSSVSEIELAIQSGVKPIGFELIFRDEASEFANDEFIEKMHNEGYILWVNALSIWDNCNMSAMHNDETAILEDMNKGWGWLIDKGYDVIQTDWPLLLDNYIKSKNK